MHYFANEVLFMRMALPTLQYQCLKLTPIQLCAKYRHREACPQYVIRSNLEKVVMQARSLA